MRDTEALTEEQRQSHYYGYTVDVYGDLRFVAGGELTPIPIEEFLSISFVIEEGSLCYMGSHGIRKMVTKRVEEFNAKIAGTDLTPLTQIDIPVSLIKSNHEVLDDINRVIANTGYVEAFVKKYLKEI
jgi:hypothetical protein